MESERVELSSAFCAAVLQTAAIPLGELSKVFNGGDRSRTYIGKIMPDELATRCHTKFDDTSKLKNF